MESNKRIDHSAMRARNLAVVLSTLGNRAPVSRTELARITGLNKATVTSLIKELERVHFVNETATKPSEGVGRRPRGLALHPDAGSIIALETGVDFISAIVTDFTAKPVWRRSESTAGLGREEAVLSRACEIADEASAIAHKLPGRVFGITWGVPGLVDLATGSLIYAPNLGWKDVPLRELLSSRLGIQTYVDNEANLAALGESHFGAGRDFDYMLFVSAGVGLGGGIVLRGELLSGADGFAGEIGHMTMDPDGALCRCGNKGCWETLVSQWAVFRRIHDAVDAGGQTSLKAASEGGLDQLTIPLVVDAASKGDELSLQVLRETGQWLGIGIASLINVLNPQRVVFGGILSLAHQFLLPVICDVIKDRAWQWSSRNCDVVVADYGAEACLMGGVATVYRGVLSELRNWT